MDEINCHWKWSQKTLGSVPPLLWSRLLESFRPLLEFRVGVGDALVLRWAHRHVQQVATSLYLGLDHERGDGHKAFNMLAGYFSGRLAEEDLEEQEEQELNRGREPHSYP